MGATQRVLADPYHQFEFQPVVAHVDQPYVRLAVSPGNRAGQGHGGGDAGFAHQFLVGAVGHAERHVQAPHFLAIGPVDHAPADEFRIRHQHVHQVGGGDARVAQVNLGHLAGDAGLQVDDVTDLDGLVEQDNDARDEIVEHVLQAETHAQAERTAKEGEAGQVEAQVVEADDGADDPHQIGADAAQHVNAGVVLLFGKAHDGASDQSGKLPDCVCNNHQPDQAQQRDVDLAYLEQGFVSESQRFIPQAMQEVQEYPPFRNHRMVPVTLPVVTKAAIMHADYHRFAVYIP